MAIYEVDEFRFEVPDGYVDRSINILFPTSREGGAFNLVITRDARNEESLAQQVTTILKQLMTQLPRVKVLGQRERAVGALPGREVRLHAVQDKVLTYQRQVFVSYYDTLLTFTVSSARGMSGRCDALTEWVFDSLRFKKL